MTMVQPDIGALTSCGQQLKKKMNNPAWAQGVRRKQRAMGISNPLAQRTLIEGPGIPPVSAQWDCGSSVGPTRRTYQRQRGQCSPDGIA